MAKTLFDEALGELKERRKYCREMELMCLRAGEPDIALHWSIKAVECSKAIKVVRRVSKKSE